MRAYRAAFKKGRLLLQTFPSYGPEHLGGARSRRRGHRSCRAASTILAHHIQGSQQRRGQVLDGRAGVSVEMLFPLAEDNVLDGSLSQRESRVNILSVRGKKYEIKKQSALKGSS